MHNFKTIQEFLDFVENQKRFQEKVSLDNMLTFCNILGNPQKKFKSIHVTGTNGKGSVVSYLKNICIEHGLNVGTFTSPYIIKFNERISINNIDINDEDILKYSNIILSKYDEFQKTTSVTPSFFEFITLLCFIYFANSNIDIAIIEVGIGGLLDSTNVINPIVSCISNVSYDHMNVLGNSLEEILINKLGIVKENTPFVVGIKDQKLLKIVDEISLNKKAFCEKPLLEAFGIIKCDLESTRFTTKRFGEVELSLLGKHQIENAIVAITTFIQYYEKINGQNSYNLDKIKKAVKKTKWPGRLEIMSKEPLIVIDGGHNIDGITRICEFIKDLNYPRKRCIFACSDNKEKEKMIKTIDQYFDQIIITSFTYKRHSQADELFEYAQNENKLIMNDIDTIIDYVNKEPYELNIFLGSLYFVSEIRPKLLKEIK